jgi:hypothetical protein
VKRYRSPSGKRIGYKIMMLGEIVGREIVVTHVETRFGFGQQFGTLFFYFPPDASDNHSVMVSSRGAYWNALMERVRSDLPCSLVFIRLSDSIVLG